MRDRYRNIIPKNAANQAKNKNREVSFSNKIHAVQGNEDDDDDEMEWWILILEQNKQYITKKAK